MNKLENSKFVLHTTADGSPTLALFGGEMMHNHDGAFSETCYVYEPVVDSVLENRGNVTILSLGLGLGYVEMLAFSKALSMERRHQLTLHSFESNKFLVNSFVDWLSGRHVTLPYDEIATRFEQRFQLSPGRIRHALLESLVENKLLLRGPLQLDTQHTQPYNGICFDAFCAKTNPELWSDDLLNHVLTHADRNLACFATYAATTRLKKILKTFGFEHGHRKGFSRKRECILAHKKTTE